jgi:hypothetical protein
MIKIIHEMADGSVRDNIDGYIVKSEHIYEVVKSIILKQEKNQTSGATKIV